MENNKLSIRMHGIPIGILKQSNGKLEFHLKPWSENQLQISQSLPISETERIFPESECKSFFEGLLPDSEEARKALAKKYGFSERNIFKLLEAIGAECAGAISFHHINSIINEKQNEIIEADYKTDQEIEIYLNEKLTSNPLLNGIDDIRLSLAGVQNKICIVVDCQNPATAPIGLPHRGTLSTHILKPEIKNFPNSAYNEYFCLTLAKEIGINTANVTFRKIGSIPCIIVERYDRAVIIDWQILGSQRITRLHQEDFCQALGKSPSQKYQNEGGPSFNDCFELLKNVSPLLARDWITFIDYILFNFIVGNTDAHGKNFSLLYDTAGFIPRLAPLYDVLCCQIYPEHSEKMAMKIDSKYLAKDVHKRHWEKFYHSINISFPQFKKRAKEFYTILPLHLNNVIEHEKEIHPEYKEFTKELQILIHENINHFLKKIDYTA